MQVVLVSPTRRERVFEMATDTTPSPTSASLTDDRPFELNDKDVLYEVVDGRIIEVPPMGAREADLAATLMRILSSFAWQAGLGRVQMEMLFLLDPAKNLKRRPDLSFVSFARWPRGRRVPQAEAWDVVPNLAVEVVSPSNTANEVRNKTKEYFGAGAERVWVIYPEFAEIHDFDSPTAVRILTRDQTLDGGSLLRGFQLSLVELFPEQAEPETVASA
jgi:Uma2 family endonuclease